MTTQTERTLIRGAVASLLVFLALFGLVLGVIGAVVLVASQVLT
jgi:hypothetical protein